MDRPNGRKGARYNVAMEHDKTQSRADRSAEAEPRAIGDQVTFEPVPVPTPEPATGLILGKPAPARADDDDLVARPVIMSTTIAISLTPEELSELDDSRRDRGVSREEAVHDALRWYVRWGEQLSLEDPIGEEIDP